MHRATNPIGHSVSAQIARSLLVARAGIAADARRHETGVHLLLSASGPLPPLPSSPCFYVTSAGCIASSSDPREGLRLPAATDISVAAVYSVVSRDRRCGSVPRLRPGGLVATCNMRSRNHARTQTRRPRNGAPSRPASGWWRRPREQNPSFSPGPSPIR